MKMNISHKSQTIMIWWGLIFLVIYWLSIWGLLNMMPPPDATLTEMQVAEFYRADAFGIRLGAMITSWVSAFGVPFAVVASVQCARLERLEAPDSIPVWSILCFAGGILMTMFLVFPPIMWGVAAFTAERDPGLTTIMHELSLLTFTTTDQYYIFMMIPMAIVSLTQKQDERSAFPRWYGYFTLWAAVAFEVGALAFMFKEGPFSWNGALVFWMPLVVYGVWLFVTAYIFLRAIRRQSEAGEA